MVIFNSKVFFLILAFMVLAIISFVIGNALIAYLSQVIQLTNMMANIIITIFSLGLASFIMFIARPQKNNNGE